MPDNFRGFIFKLINTNDCSSFLDIGCGHGHDLKYFKDAINKDTVNKYTINYSDCPRFVGIDKLEKSIALAVEAYAGEGIEFCHMDVAQGLKFNDKSFDIIYSMNVVECIADKQKLVSEIHRVLTDKGQVICCHCDGDSVMFNGNDKKLISHILKKYNEWQQPWMDDADSCMGRRLWGLFNSTGLFKSKIYIYNHIETDYEKSGLGWNMVKEFGYMVEAGIISKEDYSRFCNDIRETAAKGEYIYVCPIYVYKGIKS